MARLGRQRDSGKERFWRRLLRQWRRSGLTVREFCDQQAVSEPSFYAWRRTIAERDQQRCQRQTNMPAGEDPCPARPTALRAAACGADGGGHGVRSRAQRRPRRPRAGGLRCGHACGNSSPSWRRGRHAELALAGARLPVPRRPTCGAASTACAAWCASSSAPIRSRATCSSFAANAAIASSCCTVGRRSGDLVSRLEQGTFVFPRPSSGVVVAGGGRTGTGDAADRPGHAPGRRRPGQRQTAEALPAAGAGSTHLQ